MRRVWPFLLILCVVGVAAGVSISGRPVASDPFRVNAGAIATPPVVSSDPVTTDPVPPTSATIAVTAPTSAGSTTSTTSTTAPTTTLMPTTSPTTTVPARDRAFVRAVVANGSARAGLAKQFADVIRPLGYESVFATNATGTLAVTTVYYRQGFAPEARQLAADLGVPGAVLEPLADLVVSNNDGAGDVIAVLGVDFPGN